MTISTPRRPTPALNCLAMPLLFMFLGGGQALGEPAPRSTPKRERDHGEAPAPRVLPGEKVLVAYLDLGQKRFAQGDLPGALQAFNQAHATNARDPRPLYMRATVYQRMKKAPEAIADFRAALQLDPKLVDVRAELGALLTESGQPEEAVPLLLQAVKEKPDHFEAQFNLGIAQETLGRWAQAADAYRSASKLKPTDPDVRLNLAVALRRLGKADEALAVAREAVRLAPDDAQAHLNLGLLLSEAKRYDEAVAEMTAATRLKPDLFKAWWRLGVVHMRRDQPQLAVAALSRAKEIRATPDVLTDLGLAQRKLGNTGLAEASFRAALQQDSKYVPARIHLAWSLAQAGNCKEAERELALLPKGPDYTESVNRVRAKCQFLKQAKGK